MKPDKTVVIIAGPTAVGKTALAIDIALHWQTEIISADSRQCYRELNIGVARPSPEELAKVPHHFIASHSIHDNLTAASFEQYALAKTEALFQNYELVVMTGGTGLYLRAFCEGFDAIPQVPEEIRMALQHEYKEKGLAWLQQEVERLDPAFFAIAEQQNPQRLLRALEVFKATGKSITEFRKAEKKVRPFRIIKIALGLPREELYQRINQRVELMMQQGLEEEVKRLIPYQYLNALQTVGYKELFDYFNGLTTLTDAVQLIRQHTRNYAKRQETWFRKEADYAWFTPDEKEVRNYIEKSLSRPAASPVSK